jgi:structure-specific endonuclease subunit SLX1
MHCCYIIYTDEGKTYNGYTNNISRRIKQHNGILVGGAKYTKNNKNDYEWKYLAILTGFIDNNEALSCEWRIKHPTNTKIRPKKYCGIEGRINTLNFILQLENWTNKSTGIISGKNYILYIHSNYEHLIDMELFKNNIKIKNLNELL